MNPTRLEMTKVLQIHSSVPLELLRRASNTSEEDETYRACPIMGAALAASWIISIVSREGSGSLNHT